MPRTDLANINPELPQQPKQDDWMSGLNNLVNNVKSTVTEIKTMADALKPQAAPGAPPNTPAPAQPGIKEFIGLIRAAGYGDTPIGKLITMVAPYSINQIELAGKQFLGGKKQNGA
jgi:hypothetical protein